MQFAFGFLNSVMLGCREWQCQIGRVWSRSTARRCGASSSQVTSGHRATADQRSMK
jgi:hypothetical protein